MGAFFEADLFLDFWDPGGLEKVGAWDLNFGVVGVVLKPWTGLTLWVFDKN